MDAIAARPVRPPARAQPRRDLWPLLANLTLSRDTTAVWAEHHFDDLVAPLRLAGMKVLLVSDPDGVRHYLTSTQARYRRPIPARRIALPVTGNGVFMAEGADWRRQRRLLAPSFTPASVGLLTGHFLAAAETMIRDLPTRGGANLAQIFQQVALDAVLRALFSLPDAQERARLASLVRDYIVGPAIPNAFDVLARADDDYRFAMLGRLRAGRAWMQAVDHLVARRTVQAALAGSFDMLDLLIGARDAETGEALGPDEVRDQAATMLFAGFETTARLLFWTCYLLCLDPAEQARVRAEVREFGPDRVTGLADLQHWPRLRCVLLESLRLYPAGGFLLREATEPDEILGHRIEPGDQVWSVPFVMHRHRRLWDDPLSFRPDRFAGQASPWTQGGAFMPFGAGPRICIGATFAMTEASLVLAALLARFEIALDDGRPVLPVGKMTTVPSREPRFRLTPV
jgi:cytochrome P450